MKPIQKGIVVVLLIGIIFIFSFGVLYRAQIEPTSRTQYIMGTLIKITAYDQNPEPGIEAAFDRMREIELQVGRADSSDISKINTKAGGTPIQVRPDTWKMMMMAKQYWLITDKAFDVTVGPLVNLWGFGYDGQGRFPSTREISGAMPKIGTDKAILNPSKRSIRLAYTGMLITVAGIAKGYAVEEAMKVLKAKGIKNAIINGGNSSIKVIGSGPPRRGWRIGVEDPRHLGKIIGVIALKSGQSMSTSADNKRFFIKDGKRYSHIIDPRTGYPTNKDLAQVTIITENATESDILTKALFLNDLNWNLHFLKQQKLQAILVNRHGKILTTSGLKLGI
jgi:FAD:protein FMN transferase